MNQVFGLLGFPLSHSFSPKYFKNKWAQLKVQHCDYNIFEYQNIQDAVAVLKATKQLSGFNITIPHKQNILPFLHQQTESVLAIGACNCVHIVNGKWVGYNTDYLGFMQSFKSLILPAESLGKALVLGNGGAAKAVFFALQKLGIAYSIVERNPQQNNISYNSLTDALIKQYKYVINTTPIGTYPNISEAPLIPYVSLTPNHIAYDLVYNPQESLFLQQCKKQGATIKNGSDMLVIQAEESWNIWTS